MLSVVLDDRLSRSDDAELRRRARRMDWQNGEDAYHEAVIEWMRKSTEATWKGGSPVGWLTHNTKFKLGRLYDREKRGRVRVQAFIEGMPPPVVAAFEKAKSMRWAVRPAVCKRGHPLTPDNLVRSGPQSKTCRICKLARDKVYNERRPQRWQKQPKSNSLTSLQK